MTRFHDWVEHWVQGEGEPNPMLWASEHNGVFNLRLNCSAEHIRAPIKMPQRAIPKVVRTYGRNAARLTDIVRCSVVFEDLDGVAECVAAIRKHCGLGAFQILRIRNRLDHGYDAVRPSAGY